MRLCDIIETYISGDWGNDEPTEDASCPVSCIRGADIVPIYNSEYNNIPLRYISEKSLSNRALQEGDIVIEKSGGSPTQSTGRVVYISKELLEEKQDIVCSNFCAAFRIKPEWDAKYVYYYLQHVYNAGVFFNFEGKTSGLKNLIMDTAFKSITIKKIAIETQRSIATVLSTIESKMAANRAINHYLEAMVKQLYDYWFVQFDFPDANGKPYKSSGGNMIWNEKLKREIPEGWSSEIFSELSDINKSTLSKRDNIPTIEYLDTSSITEGIVSETQYLDRHSAPSRAQRKVEDLTIVYSCVRPRLLHYGILCNPPTNFIVSTGFATIDAKDKAYSILLYYFLISCETTEHLGDIADTAVSSYPAINPSDIGSLRTIVPPRSLSLSFQEKVEVMIREAKRLHLENKELEKKRDYLLPLVMTGQVSVKQLNNDLPLTFIIIRKTSQI